MIEDKEVIKYTEFVNLLKLSLKTFKTNQRDTWEDSASKYIDGLASDEARRLISIDTRRKYGIFFTNSKLAKIVFRELKPNFDKHSTIYDPACGAANLIISAYDFCNEKKIAIDDKIHFVGTDIHSEFIEAAKLRCAISQLLFTGKLTNSNKVKDTVFNFAQADGLFMNKFYDQATHIIVNPPFNLISPEENLSWSNGKVSAAALFIDKIVQFINPRTAIYAILPEVLRNGSNYEKWRKMVNEKCIAGTPKLLGQFDKHADVDVFAIKLIKRKKVTHIVSKEASLNTNAITTIEDLFDICVGPVVDNRDPKCGENKRFLVSKGLKGWNVQTDIMLYRRHTGKSFMGPFVVIKRTSRMGDHHRAIATIINIHESVYIDNHLIVLTPKSKSLEDCYILLSILKDKKTDDWINEKIRCRHLTVKIVSKIPL